MVKLTVMMFTCMAHLVLVAICINSIKLLYGGN